MTAEILMPLLFGIKIGAVMLFASHQISLLKKNQET